MTAVAWPSVLDALTEVERLPADEAGLLSFGAGGPVDGGLYVERNQVCWAAAPNLKRRLLAMLRTCARLEPDQLDGILDRCRVEGRQLGALLVAEGHLDPDTLALVLRRHSAESIVELCRPDRPTRWASRGEASYRPLVLLRPLEVLLDIGALYAGELQAAARDQLHAVAGPSRPGAAFALDDRHDGVVPIAERGAESSVSGLRDLGRWAAAQWRAGRELGTTPGFVLSSDDEGAAAVVWRRDQLLYVIRCDERFDAAVVTGRLLAEAR